MLHDLATFSRVRRVWVSATPTDGGDACPEGSIDGGSCSAPRPSWPWPRSAAGLAISATGSGDRTAQVRHAVKGGKAKNVILLLGDGMGDSEITSRATTRTARGGLAARHRRAAADRRGYTTYSLIEKPDDPHGKPNYVPDSAATGTAWSTGHKTYERRASPTTIDDESLPTILELAQEAGFATGNVSTAEITDATPAVLDSHVNDRGCQGPADMATCPQYAKPAAAPARSPSRRSTTRVDVVLGGGKARFDQTVDRRPVRRQDRDRVRRRRRATPSSTDAAGLAGVPTPAKQGARPLRPGQHDLEWTGAARRAHPASGPQACDEDNRSTGAERAAPRRHDDARRSSSSTPRPKARKGDKGFFLQVEGASIDKQDHAANPCGQIGETVAFDKAVQVARAYAAKHPDTLVIVTADHGHTSQIVEEVDDDHAGRPEHPDDRRRRAALHQLRDRRPPAARSSTPAPRCASRPRARRRRTSSA